MGNLDLWQPHEKDTASKRNQAVRAINSNLPVVGGVGVLSSTNVAGGGTVVSVDQSSRGRVAVQIGKVVTAGPGGETDYTDYRYWVQLVSNRITSTSHVDTGALDLHEIDPSAYNGSQTVIVTAYDATSFASGAHSIASDDFVYLAPISIDEPKEDGTVPRARWFILGGGGGGGQGTEQYQVNQMVAANKAGWDFVLSNP